MPNYRYGRIANPNEIVPDESHFAPPLQEMRRREDLMLTSHVIKRVLRAGGYTGEWAPLIAHCRHWCRSDTLTFAWFHHFWPLWPTKLGAKPIAWQKRLKLLHLLEGFETTPMAKYYRETAIEALVDVRCTPYAYIWIDSNRMLAMHNCAQLSQAEHALPGGVFTVRHGRHQILTIELFDRFLTGVGRDWYLPLEES